MAILPDRTNLTTPADGDLYVTTDVSDTTDAATGTDKKITWSNIKATLKTYFDTLYHIAGGTDVPITDGGTGASTAAGARTNLGVDAAGTDNSTDVTLSGTGTYISIAGQVITVDPITESDISDLGAYITDITGSPLSELSDVTITTIASGEVLKWNGSAWINQTLTEANIQAILAEGAFANGDKTKLDGIETGADVTDTTNVTAAGALMDSELTSITDVKALNQSVVSGATPTFTTTNFTDATDKRLMTDAQETKLDSVETNADVTDATNVTAAGALMDSELTDIVAVKALADASIASVNTGTSTTEFVTPDGLQGSIRNLRFIDMVVVDPATDVATGTGLFTWTAPFAGTIVQDDTDVDYFAAYTTTAGTTGTMVVDIHKGGTTIMTTNKLDIETTELDTTTAVTQPDLTTTTFSKGDVFTVDVDAVHTTAAKGLLVRMAVRPD